MPYPKRRNKVAGVSRSKHGKNVSELAWRKSVGLTGGSAGKRVKPKSHKAR